MCASMCFTGLKTSHIRDQYLGIQQSEERRAVADQLSSILALATTPLSLLVHAHVRIGVLGDDEEQLRGDTAR